MSSTHVVLHPPPYKSNNLSGFPLVSCHDHVSHQQYHTGVLAGKERWLQQMEQEGPSPMLTNLSQELVELIFEQHCSNAAVKLRLIDPACLRELRRVNRRFNLIATPIIYRTIELVDLLVADDAETRFPQVIEDIVDFTRHVAVRSILNPRGVQRLLTRIKRLRTLRWRYVPAEAGCDEAWLPSALLTEEQRHSPELKLFVEDLPLREQIGGDNRYLESIPVDILASLKITTPAHPPASRVSALKELLLRSPRLEEFHYKDRGQGTQFLFGQGERMPALRYLVLTSYDWDHDKEDFLQHWDFSRLTSLHLTCVPSFNFLQSVPFSSLANLRHFTMQDHSAHLPDRTYEATREMCTLVRSHIKALESLSLTCHVKGLLLDTILRHRATLEVLSLRDHTGFSDAARRCPTLQPASLSAIGRSATRIRTLELDMDVMQCDPRFFLRALSEFPQLTDLTLHVQTLIDSSTVEIADEDEDEDQDQEQEERWRHKLPWGDWDRDAAVRVFTALVSNRERNQPHLTPWQRITINVGGWRPVMIRRLGAAWRQLNDRGIFAERCFVLRRRPDGLYGMTEVLGVENASSTRTTPEH